MKKLIITIGRQFGSGGKDVADALGRRLGIPVYDNELITKDGFLLGVGANYILLNEIGTDDITACDFYNIKFIRFLY